MRIGSEKHTYEWIDNWAKIPDTESARAGWAHHGIVVTEVGDVIIYHPGDPAVLTFDRDGKLRGSWDSGLVEGHGITIVKEGSTEYLWIADNGDKSVKEDGYKPPNSLSPGQVVKKTLDGRTAMVLRPPDLAVYREGRYSPTAVAVDEERHGGNGDVWVSDGYGMYYVHRYDKNGNYLSSINGDEGAGRFSIPHGVWIDRRKPEPELYIAEHRRVEEGSRLLRFEGRVQVYDLNGKFKRVFGAEHLGAPRRGIVIENGVMILPELNARVATFDADDNFGGYFTDNTEAMSTDGWPNSRDESGALTRRKDLRPGIINSPHDMAMDAEGNLYLAEFLIGGRITKLAKRS